MCNSLVCVLSILIRLHCTHCTCMCRLRGQLPDIKKTLETIVHLKEKKASTHTHTHTMHTSACTQFSICIWRCCEWLVTYKRQISYCVMGFGWPCQPPSYVHVHKSAASYPVSSSACTDSLFTVVGAVVSAVVLDGVHGMYE